MNRRDFLSLLASTAFGVGTAPIARAGILTVTPPPEFLDPERHLKDYLYKMRYFNREHRRDVHLSPGDFRTLESSLRRLRRLQRTVGHGNFYLLSFDDALKIAKNYSRVGAFTKSELAFLEKLFYADGSAYGFYGEKPLKNLTDTVQRRSVVKIPRTGNYLYRGKPLETYRRIREQIGDKAVLTSGVRSVIKQFMLFLSKTYKSKGNLSMASRSLAPPGYSYHGVGDFDVGQVGYGFDNFTNRFTETDVYRKLRDHGFLKLRYDHDNLLGVRFEPWHIRCAGPPTDDEYGAMCV